MSIHTCGPCPICQGKGYFFVDMSGHVNSYQCEDTDDESWKPAITGSEGDGRVGVCEGSLL